MQYFFFGSVDYKNELRQSDCEYNLIPYIPTIKICKTMCVPLYTLLGILQYCVFLTPNAIIQCHKEM